MSEHSERHLMGMITHHKCGTIWMKKIILGLSRLLEAPVIGVWKDISINRIPSNGAAFLVNWNGFVPDALWEFEGYKPVHLIRDPRDVLLSGCQYHHFAPLKGELFLQEPRSDLGSMTYQNYVCSLESYQDKLMLEMTEKHQKTLEEMLNFPTDQTRYLRLRYEDLLIDSEMNEFQKLLDYWCIAAKHQEEASQIIWNANLFGALADPEARDGRSGMHILSGANARWKKELPRSVGQIYAKRFGAALKQLGYEQDDTWVDGLHSDPEPFNLPRVQEVAPAFTH